MSNEVKDDKVVFEDIESTDEQPLEDINPSNPTMPELKLPETRMCKFTVYYMAKGNTKEQVATITEVGLGVPFNNKVLKAVNDDPKNLISFAEKFNISEPVVRIVKVDVEDVKEEEEDGKDS